MKHPITPKAYYSYRKIQSEIDPTNPVYRFYINIYSKLPLCIVKYIGPWIRESLGI